MKGNLGWAVLANAENALEWTDDYWMPWEFGETSVDEVKVCEQATEG